MTFTQLAERTYIQVEQTHLKKSGTPTMGGIIILFGVVLGALLWAKLSNFFIQLIFISTVWMGLVGFFDDYLRQREVAQFLFVKKYLYKYCIFFLNMLILNKFVTAFTNLRENYGYSDSI